MIGYILAQFEPVAQFPAQEGRRRLDAVQQRSGTQTNSDYTLRPFSAILCLTPNPAHWH